jgi:long-subunit acyl-CoA synthetase (AMP-forming)
VAVSGGALLPPYLESFFAMTGLQVRLTPCALHMCVQWQVLFSLLFLCGIGCVIGEGGSVHLLLRSAQMMLCIPHAQLLAGYGLTETSPVVCNQLAERRVLGTIGSLAPHTQVRIVDPATGREVPAGEEGVLKGECLGQCC